ncbi:glycine cleavage system protein GcvH [Niveibacterium terrae]|uniref:glycine cleavage system protein GcvH n=1 Tax=Niveibacterium terrae TaxID=3373598 RepID=UPI003A8E7719
MSSPSNLRYTESHEWARLDPDGTVTIGITDHAQSALGDVVFVELPEVGRSLAAAESCAVVESVKAASDIYAPIAGEVVATNAEVVDAPESINADAYAAWLFKLKPANGEDIVKLLDAAAYDKIAD